MVADPHSRLETIMSKLSQSASPRAKKPLILRRKKEATGLRVSSSAMESAPQCRPWDGGDLMRRLAIFKAMTWFGKPKAISAVTYARRGWINVEMDVICREACEACLLFSIPFSWNLQQVEKAAAVFSLKLIMDINCYARGLIMLVMKIWHYFCRHLLQLWLIVTKNDQLHFISLLLFLFFHPPPSIT